ncbi:MAG: hypothetical protein GX811_13940 [Lentisphaerae bacterium]|nr:hypothetical protein [Lentisphaerota bacterium]
MKKILIPTRLDNIAKETLETHGGYTVIQDETTPLDTLLTENPDAYAIIVRSEKITKEHIDILPNLKLIIRAGSGYNTIDTVYARSKNIDVMNTPGANSNAVAEEVIALMLADARHIIQADEATRAGRWEKKKFVGTEITGKTVGIVGLGNIGQLVAKRLSGFEVKLLGYDPLMSQERMDKIKIRVTDLATVFAESDYITLHIPENDETRKMINEELLSKMKPGSTLINCARAGVIDEAALRKIKPEKNIRFLNDVYPKDAEGEKTVADIADIMLPHLGASTHEASINAARRAAEQLTDYDDKGFRGFIVNRETPEGLDVAHTRLAFILTKLCHNMVGDNTKLRALETSFYGSLKPFHEWLMLAIVKALSGKMDQSMDFKSASQYLLQMGIDYKNREVDPSKAYENSLTIDLVASHVSGDLRRVSIRGTVAEGIMMISRINDFDKLYFEPRGHVAFFIYEDRPGVLGQIGATFASFNINIEDVRNPHHSRVNQSLGIMKVNKPVSDEILKVISDKIEAISSFYYDFG